jgi:hypothetical protein
MGAYSSVDHQVRKKLDEMLKTWKAPVPGSLDKRPVFPVEITKKIENALIQAKTAALQQQQEQKRNQQELMRRRAPAATPAAQWRSTPTPPQNGVYYPPSTPQAYQAPPALQNGQGPVSGIYTRQERATADQSQGVSPVPTAPGPPSPIPPGISTASGSVSCSHPSASTEPDYRPCSFA